MGSYENDNLVLTAQYLSATDNPFVAVDIERRGFSFFGEGRQGPTGWSVIGGLDLFDPDGSNDSDSQRRLIFGGAHWSEISARDWVSWSRSSRPIGRPTPNCSSAGCSPRRTSSSRRPRLDIRFLLEVSMRSVTTKR